MKNELTKELVEYTKTNVLTDELKRAFLELIIEIGKRKQYQNLSDSVKIYCEARAYEDCCRHAVHFNSEKSDDATAYVKTIIRSSFALMIGKHLPSSIVETIEF